MVQLFSVPSKLYYIATLQFYGNYSLDKLFYNLIILHIQLGLGGDRPYTKNTFSDKYILLKIFSNILTSKICC